MAADKRAPAPGGWEWLEVPPWGMRSTAVRFLCGLRFVSSTPGAFGRWAAVDAKGGLRAHNGGHPCPVTPHSVVTALMLEAGRILMVREVLARPDVEVPADG